MTESQSKDLKTRFLQDTLLPSEVFENGLDEVATIVLPQFRFFLWQHLFFGFTNY